MSTDLPNVSDPCGYYGDISVTVFCGPAELGEERRVIALSCFTRPRVADHLDLSLEQFRALADAIDSHAPRPLRGRSRTIEAAINYLTYQIATSNVVATRVVQFERGQPSTTVWRVVISVGVAIEGSFSLHRDFDTEEEAQAFAKGVLG